jgi:hypothetical protein
MDAHSNQFLINIPESASDRKRGWRFNRASPHISEHLTTPGAAVPFSVLVVPVGHSRNIDEEEERRERGIGVDTPHRTFFLLLASANWRRSWHGTEAWDGLTTPL